ncbi:MAG: VCBS repeat-containing protein, partial [Oscillochloris sp.]|nr:VCBS repeat-containing protein [Oscillochloris sp.]
MQPIISRYPHRPRARFALALLALALLFGLGGLAFADPFSFPRRESFGSTNGYSTALALGDLNGDGTLDLVVGSDNLIPSGAPGYVYLNDGTGAFHVGAVSCGNTTNVRCFGDPTASLASLALGDLDADGDLDLVAGYSDASLHTTIFRNDGSGTLDAGTSVGPAGLFTTALAVADLDGTHGLDLIVGASSGQNAIYLNDGLGGFGAGIPFGTGSDKTVSLAVGDVDGLYGPDLVVGNAGEQSVLYLNDGTGHFASGTIICGVTPQTRCVGGASDPTSALALGRLDGDSALDLVVARNGLANQRYLNDGSGSFVSPLAFGLASGATRALAVGDFDRDGDLDVATGEAGRANELYINNGAGDLSLQASFGSTATPSAMRVGDVDGDGALDLVLSNGGLQNEIYLNSGAGSFAETGARAVGGFAAPTLRVAMGDLSGDGNLDLVMLRENLPPQINLLDGQGNPTSTTAFGEPTPRYSDLALGDLDGDSDLDIVLASLGGQNLVLFNQGGFFHSGAVACGLTVGVACFGSGDDPTYSVALADLDGDGPLDIVVGNGTAAYSGVYLNRGAAFGEGRIACDGSDPAAVVCLGGANLRTRSVAAGDLDGDGDNDLVLGNEGQPNAVYLNNGSGAFTSSSPFGSGSDTTLALALGDLNGDGLLDIAAGNYQDQSAIFFNQGGASFASSPAICRLGVALVTCFGSGLDPTQALLAADMDDDGDLDLIAGQLGGQSAVYVNDGSGQLLARRSFGGASARTTSLAVGDLDHDGDHDLAIGRADQASLIYLNAQTGAALQAFAPPQISVTTPGSVARPGASASATIITTPLITITYQLSAPAAAVAGFYSLDGGGSWLPAVTPSGKAVISLPQPDTSGSYSYPWDTFASGFFGQSDALVVRLVAYPATAAFPGADAGSQQIASVAAQSYPFRARGTQVRVLDAAGQPVRGAT